MVIQPDLCRWLETRILATRLILLSFHEVYPIISTRFEFRGFRPSVTNRAVQPKRMARALKLILDSGTSYVAKISVADQLHAVTAPSSLFSHNAKSGFLMMRINMLFTYPAKT